MPGVNPNIIIHHLSVYKEARPVAQKKRKMSEEKCNASRKEADKHLKANFIKIAQYTTWLDM